jgi:pyrroloquinoline quinone biosynthesis protein B
MSYCSLLLIIAGTMVAQSTGGKRDSAATLIVLGTLQDAGSPHIGCRKKCCNHLWDHPDPSRKVVSLGIYDPISNSRTLIDATPDISHQIKILSKLAPETKNDIPEHIIITHAHIGHYTGLMYLGREAMNTKNVPVSVMPGMYQFITNNGPWNQLVKLKNIDLKIIGHETAIPISSGLTLTPFLVPHRAEYSETIGLLISGKNKKALFIPDIDKWHLWEKNIVEEIKKVDIAFLDATFYDSTEVNNRNIAEIPHPFVVESLELFKNLPEREKSKIHFLHFNHTNPLLDPESAQTKDLLLKGFNIAKMGDTFKL